MERAWLQGLTECGIMVDDGMVYTAPLPPSPLHTKKKVPIIYTGAHHLRLRTILASLEFKYWITRVLKEDTSLILQTDVTTFVTAKP